MRTSSPMESINSVVQRQFPAITNIYKFAECLRLYESIRSTDLLQISGTITSQRLKRARKIDEERDQKIKFFSEQLSKGTITVQEFLEAMACKEILPGEGAYKAFHTHPNKMIETFIFIFFAIAFLARKSKRAWHHIRKNIKNTGTRKKTHMRTDGKHVCRKSKIIKR